MSTPTDDWSHFYQQYLSNPELVYGDQRHDTAVVTTTVEPSAVGTVPASSSGGHLSTPEGRVGKPARKRSRASRRTPTTLLNTDTTNFRAMVQQFTGDPSFAPGSAAAHPGGPTFGFSFGGRHQPHLHPGSLTLPPVGFQSQYQQQQLMQHQNQGYMFSSNTNDNNLVAVGAGDHLVQRLGGNPRPNVEVGSEGFVAAGVSSQVPSSRTGSSNENRSPTWFMF